MPRPKNGFVVRNKDFEEGWEPSLDMAMEAANNWSENFPTQRPIWVEDMSGTVVYRPTKKNLALN